MIYQQRHLERMHVTTFQNDNIFECKKNLTIFVLNANEITVGIIFNKKNCQPLNRLQLPMIEVQVKCCTW